MWIYRFLDSGRMRLSVGDQKETSRFEIPYETVFKDDASFNSPINGFRKEESLFSISLNQNEMTGGSLIQE